jgi:cytochrome c peroxidase
MARTLHPGGWVHQEEGWSNAAFQLKAFIDFLDARITPCFQKFPTFPGSKYDSQYALTAPYFHNGEVKTLVSD